MSKINTHMRQCERLVIAAALRNMQRDIDDGEWKIEDFVGAQFDHAPAAVQREIREMNLMDLIDRINH